MKDGVVNSGNVDSDVDADIVIIGGGMAGLAFAAALSEMPLQIVVVDPQDQPGPEHWANGFDPRVSALSLASERLLQHVGAWPLIVGQRVCPYSRMQVWDGEGTGEVTFTSDSLADDFGVDHLGHIVENRVTQWALSQQVKKNANVSLVQSRLAGLRQGPKGWRVTLANGLQYTPSLVVGADGGRSMVRQLAGFRVRAWHYQHTAIVTTVSTENPHQHSARQIFLPTGPLAFLPLVNHNSATDSQCHCSIVWSCETDYAEQLLALDDNHFMGQLGYAFEYRLGKIVAADSRYSFPLLQQHATHYAQPGLALIGDAAHTIHPLAGQGINLGFLDAAVLAEEVAAATQRGLSAGDHSLLRRYERRRKTHNLLTMGAMEGFKRLFEPLHWLLITARNEGMKQFNQHYLAKQQVMAHAMGLAGDLPEMIKK